MERMIERAKEELDILEKQHPDRFDYLKLELRSFISLLQSHQLLLDPLPTTSTATTQASTSTRKRRGCKKRRKVGDEDDDGMWENENDKNQKKKMTVRQRQKEQRDRVDEVLEKAQACLRKIQDFKFSLVC